MQFSEDSVRLSLFLFFSSLLLCSAVSLRAQAPAPSSQDQDQPLLLKTTARAVVVDVVVTQGSNDPVVALGEQAFQVLEDGKPQTIDFFEEHTTTAAPDAAGPQLPPNTVTNLPAAPQSDSVNVLLLDSLNTPKQDQANVHQQTLDFLKKMQPGTQVAIFMLGSKLRQIQGFTSDGSALLQALTDKKNQLVPQSTGANRTQQDDVDDQNHIAKMQMMTSSKGGGRTDFSTVVDAQDDVAFHQADQRVTITNEALQQLARYLAGIPGRKNLIWFSSSFPVSVFPSAKQENAVGGRQTYGASIKQTAGLLTLSKVAVYPVSAAGLGADLATGASSSNKVSQDSLSAGAGDRAANISDMEQLANDTGGKAFYNTNDLSVAASHAIADGAHYYTLVYSPANKTMDGAFRRIEVRMPEGKYTLAYRHGYYADDQAAPTPSADADPLRPLMVRGLPASTQIVFSLHATPVTPQPDREAKMAGANFRLSGPLTRYRVDFSIRPVDVNLLQTPEGRYTGKIQIALLAYDRDGKPINWTGGVMNMNLSEATYQAIQKPGIPAHFDIDLPNAELYLEAGVFDWTTRKAGTIEIPLHPTP
jgi:VWFA-related protein